MSDDLIKREDAIKAIHNYWKKRLDTLPTKESQCGEVYADIQEMDKILEHNKTLCNFINAIPSADRPQGEWVDRTYGGRILHPWWESCECSQCEEWGSGAWNFCPHCGCRMKGATDGNK